MAFTENWNVIVIGSGMGGLSCAAALAKCSHRILMLEQAPVAGGLTHTFSRHGWTWDVGLHYLGDLGPAGQARKLYDWLSDGELKMASVGPVYDTLHFPDGFEVTISRPEASLKMDLREKFPHCARAIDAYFKAMNDAQHAGHHVFALRGMPGGLATVYRFLHGHAIDKWCSRTTKEVLDEYIPDPKLRAVLSAQWGDYGGLPKESCFGIHAVIIGHYFAGAFYPEGDASVFAEKLSKTIASADGRVQVSARVSGLVVEGGEAQGVRLDDGTEYRAPFIVSNIGARNTVLKLLPEDMQRSIWAREILSLRPSPGHLSLFLGFEGDIAAHGATRSNHWVYRTWDPNQGRRMDPAKDDVPMVFVSFPSLKDPRHDPGPAKKHTGDMLVFLNWEPFAEWADDTSAMGREAYQRFKKVLETKLLAALQDQFPGLMPLLKYHELSTPLTTRAFTGAYHGATYGLETTPRRFLSSALNAKTPIRGLYLTGQDVGTPGIQGSLWGGMMAAGAIDPRVFRWTT